MLNINIDADTLHKQVAERVVDDLIDNERIREDISKRIDKRLDEIFSVSVTASLAEEARAAFRDGLSRTYQPVDAWGTPVGEPTTMKKKLESLVSTYWSQPVNKANGEPTTSSYQAVSRAEYMMAQICAKDFSETMRTAALSITGALKDGFRAQMAKHMDNLLDELFRVKSLQDQGKVEKPY